MKQSSLLLGTGLSLTLLLAACGSAPQSQVAPTTQTSAVSTSDAAGRANPNECAIFAQTPTVVARVDFSSARDGLDLVKTFEPIGGGRDQGYVLLDIGKQDFEQLRVTGLLRGWKVSIDEAATARYHQDIATVNAGGKVAGQGIGAQTISGYSCYRTVEETYAAGKAIATNNPTLATWQTFGQSWLKTKGRGGYDLYELVLTNKNKSGTKPKVLITAAIHAREYTTAELATRFAEYLTAQYGKDADVTWMLDSQEIHIVFQMNPDGRKKAEAGASWRKNANDTVGCSTTYGVDMNRNHAFGWGGPGASTAACDLTYRGPSASSEPEVKSEEALIRSLFADRRGAGRNDPAPADTSGIYIDLHSYSELVLWPFGDTATAPPNAQALQTLGRKLAYFNDYTPEQGSSLYKASGGSDDFAYGELGVASYTLELGNAFFENCSNFTSTILPDNQLALLYAVKVARAPYQLGAGPDVTGVSASAQSSSFTLSAKADGTRFNNSNGSETTYNITSAEYFVDVAPWDGGTAKTMTASDGSFNSRTENLSAQVSGLGNGKHTIYVRAKNSAGAYGPVSAIFVNVSGTTPTDPGPTTPTDPTPTTPLPGTSTYTGTASKAASSYQPGVEGFSYAGGTLKAALSSSGTADLDLALEKQSSSGIWSAVARSNGTTSNESISYSAASGTYRWRVYTYSGSGSYTLTETR